ncbi:hypothetical protein [Vulgatibacter incomptus]|uniref:DUF4261 domain-containing protein n=1 Tax=Vulgatibacter incomptus TaxID=1391653 RepID=A0A0K1PD22_9BACT|nr:hypothetical protein [Vulgatibacter incomptus]AKU91443.1 hypothetical protein AKJ08_1830 [Vulgatibacter incomptus]
MIADLPIPWPRPRYVSAGPARVAYLALLPEAGELAQKGHPLFEGFEITARYRGEDPEWFDGWVNPKGTFGSLLLRTPGIDMVALTTCKAAVVLSGEFAEPKDLGYIQRAFRIMQLLAKAGAVAVCDVESMVWWPRSDIEELGADWDFDVSDHVRVVFESAEREPGAGHLCHTLGMAKFGRPDLAIAGLEREHAEAAGEMLLNLATALAQGDQFETGDVVEPDGFPPLRCEELGDDTGSPDSTFGNRSLWLVPEEA